MLFTEEQLSIQALAKDFAKAEVFPIAARLDKDKALLRKVWDKLAALGLASLPFDEDLGGAGADEISYLLAVKEIAKASASLAVTLSVHTTVGVLPIVDFGTETQKAQYLPDLMSGKKIAAFALTEADAGSDAASGLCKATLESGTYTLNGGKIFTTNANVADIIVATARTEPDLYPVSPTSHANKRCGIKVLRL